MCILTTCEAFIEGDSNRDGRIDGEDLMLLSRAMGTRWGQPDFHPGSDYNDDGVVDEADLEALRETFGLEVKPINDDHVTDEIVIHVRADYDAQQVIPQINDRFATSTDYISPFAPMYVLKVPPDKTVAEMITLLSRDERLQYVEPNFIRHLFYEPNDPLFEDQWNMALINMPEAWDIQTGKHEVIVAVLDTGIAYENYNLFCAAPDFSLAQFVSGWDYVNRDGHPNDDHGHGTHVAGTIAQWTNNNFGGAGVAFNCTLMPVKVCDDENGCPHAAILDGIRYAVNYGAHVVNMSFGGNSSSKAERDMVAWALESGVVMVAASGNDGHRERMYPAANKEVIAVGAVGPDGRWATYSNYGDWIDVVAPGGTGNTPETGVTQQSFNNNTLKPDRYCDFVFESAKGTSMAAPHVSGLVALMMSEGQILKATDAKEILRATAIDTEAPGYDERTGAGLINAEAALIYNLEHGWY